MTDDPEVPEAADGPPPDDDSPFRESLATVAKFLEREPEAIDRIEAILASYLSGPMDTLLYGRLLDALTLFTGQDAATALLRSLGGIADDPEAFDRLHDQVPESVGRALRAAAGLFGEQVKEAVIISWENPDDWSTLTRETLVDPTTGQWKIKLDLVKYSGDTTHLELQPTGVVSLAVALLFTLNLLRDHDVSGLVPGDLLERLAENYVEFVELYSPASDSTPPAPE